MLIFFICPLFFTILVGGTLCAKLEMKDFHHSYDEESGEDPKHHELKFNHDQLPARFTGYLNRSVIEEKCQKAKPCYASDLVVPVCASDNQTYLNPGVLICAQECDSSLKVSDFGFGPCPNHEFPPTPAAFTFYSTVKSVTTTTPHTTSEDRTRVYGSVRKFFEMLGFHIHNDGGLYIEDEKKNTAWWNI